MPLDGAGFARWWVDRYTRGLPEEVRARRRAEIECDVFEQMQQGSAAGRAVAWRALRGVPADVAWHRQERRAMAHLTPGPSGSRLRHGWAVVTQNWFAPIAVLIGVFNVLTSIAVATEADGKMPGQAIGPVILAAFALVLLGGLWLRWRIGAVRASQPPAPRGEVSGRWIAAGVALLVVCLGLLVVGVSAGTPRAFFLAFGVLAAIGLGFAVVGVARAVRSADPAARSVLADGMVIVGTLPALALFWMIVPALLAIVVIAGVLTTNPRIRPAV